MAAVGRSQKTAFPVSGVVWLSDVSASAMLE